MMQMYDVTVTISIPLEDPNDNKELAEAISDRVSIEWFLEGSPELVEDEG